jgi:hypothetical protein
VSVTVVERLLGPVVPAPVASFTPPPRSIAEDVWVLDRRIGLARLGIPTRATVVRLESGGLFVHSPFRLDASTRAAVERLGPIAALVAPNSFHYLFLPEWVAAYPEARVYLAPGLRERRPHLPAGTVLGESPPTEWAGEMDQRVLGSLGRLSEVVFLHRASGTLILTDLCFNLRGQATTVERAWWRLSGEWERLGPSRTVRATLLRDAAVARQFVGRLLELRFVRIVMAHGDVVEEDAEARLRDALAAYLGSQTT